MRLGEILHILLKKYVSILVLALLSISMIAQDTIPTRSFEKETYQDLIAPTTSMTLEQPDNIVTSVDYDPVSGGYVIRTRMGDIDVATPYLMTAEDLLEGYRKNPAVLSAIKAIFGDGEDRSYLVAAQASAEIRAYRSEEQRR